MGATQVAEGPLIKHVPGGFAEWRAKESGLPPARLHSSEGEWWGKLVGPNDANVGGVDPVTVNPPVDPPVNPTVNPIDGIDSPDPNFIQPEPPAVNWDFYDDKVDPYEWKTDYKPIDWDVNYNEMPQGFGWGVPTGSPLPHQGGGSGVTEGPSGRGAVVPGGQGDKLTTRGSAGLRKPLVDFKPSPTEYAEGYNPNNRFVEKPGAIKDLKDVATDGLKLGEKWIDAIAGKTAADFKPRNPKEAVLFNKFKKAYEIFVAAVKEGGGVFGGTLYETGGGRTTMPNTKTGEVPQAHFANIYKTLRKVFAGEKDPIVMQEYGDMHWPTILSTIAMHNVYGPIVWAIPGLRTMADTIGASMNGMLMDKPNLEGNPIQDTMHRLFWIAGQAGQKAYEVSIGKLAEKLRGTPKSDKTRGTISEELSDLINIKDAFKGHKTQRIKVKLDPEFEAAGSKHLQHDPLDLQTTDPKSGAGRQKPVDTRGQREQVIGQATSPVMGPQPQGQQGQTETFGGKSPTQQRDPEIVSKTIVPTSPAGYATEPLPKDDRLTQKELDEPVQPITPEEIAELADEIMGEIPKGEKFDPDRVNPGRVDPNAVRPKTERRFTPEEQAEFNRQQRLKEQGKRDTEDERLNKALFDNAEPPPEPDMPEVEAAFERGEIDAETIFKIRQQVELERRQNYFKKNGKFKDDATNEAFSKGTYNWLEHGTADYTGKVDTNADANAQAIGVLEQAIGDLNYYYDGLERELEQGDTEGLREVQRERDGAVGEYQKQLDDIQISQARGEGLVEFQTQSAVGIYLNNPGITAEEAVKQALSQAKGAGDYVYNENREDSNVKAANFWSEIIGKVTDQIGNITQKTSDAKNANDAAANKKANEQAEASGEVVKGIKDKSDKQLAKNQADAKKFTEEMRAYLEKLAETEPLLSAKGAVDLAKLDVTGKILYGGDDGGLIQVKNKDGKLVSYVYVDPETKKNVDDWMGGWISDDDPYLGQKGILAEIGDSPPVWTPDPKPDDPGE